MRERRNMAPIGKDVTLDGLAGAGRATGRASATATFLKAGARWLDQACHRSLYSHQLRAALQLAIEDPHRAVTFAGVACTGAEITAGLFLRYKGNEWVPNPPDLSQISAIAQAQCGRRQGACRASIRKPITCAGVSRRCAAAHVVLRKCPSEHARPIDLVFLSVGGNDIGFARLVANAVLQRRDDVAPPRRLVRAVSTVPDNVVAPMSELAARYKALDRALHYILHVPWNARPKVIITAYPGMALLDDGRSVCPDGRLGMDILPHYRLSAARALAGEKVGEELYRLIVREAGARSRLAGGSRATASGSSGAASVPARRGRFSAADELRLPRKRNGYWVPYSPSNFEPYAERQRWFRTPNDAFMTAHFHVRSKLVSQLLGSSQLQWTQLLLASTYSGAFHPTAAGQAAMADAVVREARALLGEQGEGD